MNKEENDWRMPLLHIYPQKHHPNDNLVIVSNKTALLRLKETIEKALEKGEGDCIVTTSDMETYEIKIIQNDEDWQSEFWRRLQLPFFEVNESEEGEVLSVEDIIGFEIKSSEDLREKQPVMEEFKKHNEEIREKILKIIRRNKQGD